MYVADGSNHRVQVFAPDGTFLFQFGSFGTGEGQFGSIEELAVGAGRQRLRRRTDQLSKFTAGRQVRVAHGRTGCARIRRPTDGVILGTCEGEGCRRITLLDPVDGHERASWPWPLEGDDAGLLNLDPQGNVYDWSFYAGHQVVLDPSGRLIADIVPNEGIRLGRTIAWGDLWWPSPVFLPDGRAFAFGKDGLLELKVSCRPATNALRVQRVRRMWASGSLGDPVEADGILGRPRAGATPRAARNRARRAEGVGVAYGA